jgi:DNA-binding transcriptional ArsR family regulator
MGIRSRLKDTLKGFIRKPATPEPRPPVPRAPRQAPAAPEPAAAAPSPLPPVATPPKASLRKEVPEDKVRRAVLRAKEGTLKKLVELGGEASLGELHDHSEKRFFIAHRSFSNLMEELTEERLVHFDDQSGTTTLLQGGRDWLEVNG